VLGEFADVLFAVLPEAETEGFFARLETLPRLPQDAALRLAHLLQPGGAGGADAAADRLALSNRTRRRIVGVLRRAAAPLPHTESGRLRLLGQAGETVCGDLAALRLAVAPDDADAHALQSCLLRAPCCTVAQLAITGGDLLALGVPFGPMVGRMLRALLDGVMDGALANERGALCAAAKELLKTEFTDPS